ncbi:MAG: hypothetical protein RR942_06550 [Romboutsia sp.]
MMKLNNEIREMLNTPGSRAGDNYYEFEESVKTVFNSLVESNTPLFKTNVDKEILWETYLNGIPEEGRQHYNCNACKHFITRYANLVTVDENGAIKSVLWNEIQAPVFFKEVAKTLRIIVEGNPIKNIFLSDEKVLGIPKTGEWTHYSVKLKNNSISLNKSRLQTAGQILADKKEDYRMFNLGLVDYSAEILQIALDLLESNQLYRGNKFVKIVEWFKLMSESLSTVKDRKLKENLKWLAVATAPTGFCRIRSSMVGTLLDDIKEGLSLESIKRRFNEKMNPSQYMRSQSEPKVNAIKEAEKVIENLGIADSLERRYATLEEIPGDEIIWREIEKEISKTTSSKTSGTGVFAKLLAKQEETSNHNLDKLPITKMTWDKFKKTILPKAKTIEAKVDNTNKLMALVTAANPESENILQWDNSFSWYYHGGIDSEMKKRVEAEGGRYEDNEIRCSLMWNSYTDLDIHCMPPNEREIFYGDKRNGSGYLDVDMNACRGESITPVENIRWQSNAPNGRYRFYVNNYSDRNHGDNPFKVELQVKDQVFTFEGNADMNYRKTVVFEFDYYDGQVTMLSKNAMINTTENWNLDNNQFVKVNAITKSPNLWENNNLEHLGNHTFFILDGCKDLSEGKGRGFFNEMLIPDLRAIRKTLEAYTSMTPIEGVDEATACGVGYSNNSDWNLTLKISTINGGTKLIKIDRFD